MEDEQIIQLYFDRSEAAITETDKKYGQACLRIAENILGNRPDAEECVNDTYLGAWNAIPPAKPDPLSAFLFRITRNLSLTRYHANTAAKRNSRYDLSFEELSDCLGTCSSMEMLAENAGLTKAIETFLNSLSRENRVIFLRRYWFSDSYAEISRRTKLSESVISMRLVRLRSKLKKALRKEDFLL